MIYIFFQKAKLHIFVKVVIFFNVNFYIGNLLYILLKRIIDFICIGLKYIKKYNPNNWYTNHINRFCIPDKNF